MTPLFSVRTTPAFEQWLKKLAAKHQELPTAYSEALQILETDPYNRTRTHPIKMLTEHQHGHCKRVDDGAESDRRTG